MSKPLVIVMTVCLSLLPLSISAELRSLSDSELDATTVGGGLCAWFGVSSPCVASLLQMYNPQAAPQSQEVAQPLPANSTPVTLTLQASSSTSDGFRYQTATQVNSGSGPAALQSLQTKGIDLSPIGIFSRTTPGWHP